MANEEACGWCGEWFVKKGNKSYCCEECAKLAKKQARKRRKIKKRNQKKKEQVAQGLSITGVVDLMMKLSKESGKVVQYGDVQTMEYTGKLKETDGGFE